MQRAKLEEQIEVARSKEVTGVIDKVKQLVAEYGLTAEDIGLSAKKVTVRTRRAATPKYRDPKSGATWTGRGRAPAWIAGKNYNRYLIAEAA